MQIETDGHGQSAGFIENGFLLIEKIQLKFRGGDEQMNIKVAGIACIVSFFLMCTAPAMAADAADAKKLLTDSKCLKCHSVDKKKDGPSYKEVSAKYKGKPDAMDKLVKHVSEPSKIKIDGIEEDHGGVKTSDSARIKNLVEWILSI